MLKVIHCNSRRPALSSFMQFMAWERMFEKRVMKVRERELKYQKLNYTIEVRAVSNFPINL